MELGAMTTGNATGPTPLTIDFNSQYLRPSDTPGINLVKWQLIGSENCSV